MRASWCVGFAMAIWMGGCRGEPAAPTYPRVISALEGPDGSSQNAVVAPDTVRAGVAFTATIYTVDGNCHPPDGADVSPGPAVVTVTPHNLNRAAVEICSTLDWIGTRNVSVSFAVPGADTLRTMGILLTDAQGRHLDPPVLGSIDRLVVVTP